MIKVGEVSTTSFLVASETEKLLNEGKNILFAIPGKYYIRIFYSYEVVETVEAKEEEPEKRKIDDSFGYGGWT